ncbi:Protein N-acetyltransferase, RimJ/RimL family [Flavobacteriaceae bacterium MAR_2010_188]|nr:Protein N-acetyltransferase, RimJ/RimL family [Flavobacteriaceae bacterium MAR_2010_188]
MFEKKLENNRVVLEILTHDNFLKVNNIANEENPIQYSPSYISTPESLNSYFEEALNLQNEGKAIAYIIYDTLLHAYAGSTRFGNIDYHNKVLHIGWTWLGSKFQSTGLNKNIKYLMLSHAFENMKFEKVEFRIDERNLKSRKAIESIGAQLEGILRSNVVMIDEFRRNTCCYGIVRAEWREIKEELQKKL